MPDKYLKYEEKEQEGNTVSVRWRDAEEEKQDLGVMTLEEFWGGFRLGLLRNRF